MQAIAKVIVYKSCSAVSYLSIFIKVHELITLAHKGIQYLVGLKNANLCSEKTNEREITKLLWTSVATFWSNAHFFWECIFNYKIIIKLTYVFMFYGWFPDRDHSY